MKALSLWQPWATLIALGVKTIETRDWSTGYRGPLAIHATKRQPDQALCLGPLTAEGHPSPSEGYIVGWNYSGGTPRLYKRPIPGRVGALKRWQQQADPLPLGAVIATCVLVDVVPAYTVTDQHQFPYGDFSPGRLAWLLAEITPIDPVPAIGSRGLWEYERL